ncbi:hypothetical protein [Variovorax paradoxus]|uniref:hypothetical protein n=1 Tax=Variovorax paradoxus TaxID=34073 RepID=UPI001931E0C6|nr:hypothetical protein INQ48_41915 [Variovorax paradoxus]
MTRYLGLLSLAVLLALGGGCAAVPGVPDDWHLYGAGWRIGYVVEMGPGSAITAEADSDCRLDAGVRARAEQRFAVVLYAGRPALLRQRIMPVPADSPIAVHGWVSLNIENCDDPLIPQPAPHRHA